MEHKPTDNVEPEPDISRMTTPELRAIRERIDAQAGKWAPPLLWARVLEYAEAGEEMRRRGEDPRSIQDGHRD